MLKRDIKEYDNYDKITNKILSIVHLARGENFSNPMTFRDFNSDYSYKKIHTRVRKMSSIPIGTMAAQAMVLEVMFFKKILDIRNIIIKFDQINNIIAFKTNVSFHDGNNYDDFKSYFPQIKMLKNIDEVLIEIEKFMNENILSPIFKEIYGNDFQLNEINEDYYDILKMKSI